MNEASTKTKGGPRIDGRRGRRAIGRDHAPSLASPAGARVPDLARVRDQGALLNVVVEVELEPAVLGEGLREGGELRENSGLAWAAWTRAG
jgi:hypothetical protein